MGNQTSLINEIRGLLQEYGIVIPVRANNLRSHLADPATLADQNISPLMRSTQPAPAHSTVCQVPEELSHLVHHGLGRFVSSSDQAPRNLATRDSGQILRETLLS